MDKPIIIIAESGISGCRMLAEIKSQLPDYEVRVAKPDEIEKRPLNPFNRPIAFLNKPEFNLAFTPPPMSRKERRQLKRKQK